MAVYDKSLSEGTASVLVKDKILGTSSSKEFIEYLKDEGFKLWCHSKAPIERIDWIFVNLNTKVYAYGRIGIELAKPFGNHAVTINEFKVIYEIYKKYEGLQMLQFENNGKS